MRRVAAVLTAVMGIAACGGGESKPYPANVQTNFLNACETRASVSLCDCALKNIESTVTINQFIQDEQTYKSTGTLPDRERTAALACVGKAQGL